jgi:hypothetical protein
MLSEEILSIFQLQHRSLESFVGIVHSLKMVEAQFSSVTLFDYNVASTGTVTPPNIADVMGNVSAIADQTVFVLGPAIFIVMAVYGGVQVLTAAGDAEKYKNGMKTIQWAVIGFVVTVGAFLIIRLVTSIIGFDIGDTATISL